MRAILFYMLFLLPQFSAGQAHGCDFDSRFNPEKNKTAYRLFQERIQNAIAHPSIGNRAIVYLPVVIHVVARDPVQPVSVAQALNQLDVLNADFAGEGNNISSLEEEFIPLVADVQFQFCLASIDPDGLPTSGITYTQTDVKDIALQTGEGGRMSIHYDQLGGKTGWDPARYINIWIGEYGGLLGSASFPGMAAYPEEIGVIIDPRYFGSIGDAGMSGFFSGGHTLTHEMGHFFGLKHIWGNGVDASCTDGDDIADTPNAEGPYYDCPSGIQMTCGTHNMYQNFMDFTDDRCLAAFTQGQAEVMQAVLDTYYPMLVTEGTCTPAAETFSSWYDQLVWAHDQPSNTYVIYAEVNWMGQKNIGVYSADGKQVLRDTWEDQQSYLLDLANAGAGVYFVRIDDGDKQFVRKVVVYQ
jgi:Pregnancy-associated plasma protein-A/Secretion system C-terminal sorting domain